MSPRTEGRGPADSGRAFPERPTGRGTPDTFDNGKVIRLMARLVGVDLPRDKRVEVALTYIFGIGKTRAHELLDATDVSPDLRVHQLGDEELVKLRDYIEANFQVEGDLRREVTADIRRKVEIGSYQGRRHRQGLPFGGSAPRPTPGRVKAPSAPSPAGRRQASETQLGCAR